MERITKKDIRKATERLTQNAQLCGLLDYTEVVLYNAGNASNGIASVLSIRNTETQTERQGYWLPRFNYAETLRSQYKAIEAANDALRGAYDVIAGLRSETQRSSED